MFECFIHSIDDDSDLIRFKDQKKTFKLSFHFAKSSSSIISAFEFWMTSLLSSGKMEKICKQIDFYFSDFNLHHDRYLRSMIVENSCKYLTDIDVISRVKIFSFF